jgi:hypothetical protein
MKLRSFLLELQRSQVATVVLVVILGLVLVETAFYLRPMLNNGDYWRVIGEKVSVPAFSSWGGECLVFTSGHWLPRSTASVLFGLTALVLQFFGAECLDPKALMFPLVAVFAAGMVMLVRARAVPNFIYLFMVATLLALAPFFYSFYEEASVLALLPWLMLTMIWLMDEGRWMPFACISALCVACKLQMVAVLPLIIYLVCRRWRWGVLRPMAVLFTVGVLFAVSALGTMSHQKVLQANNYNRFFNGVGWVLQGVSDWSANSFMERHRYFYLHQANLREASRGFEPVKGVDLLGTSHWPTGEAIMDDADPLLRDQITRQAMSFQGFFWFFLEYPEVLVSWVISGAKIAITSDYGLKYLSQNPVGTVRGAVSLYFGWVWLAAICVGLVLCAQGRSWLPLLWLFASPYVVIFGDGFYEFEKHFVAFLMVMPFVLYVQYAAVRQKSSLIGNDI